MADLRCIGRIVSAEQRYRRLPRRNQPMFYEPAKRNHGLAFDPFKALVIPRPIGWISTISAQGVVNLAPYSFFNAVSGNPPQVMFSSEGEKDSIRNARDTGEFVCSIVTYDLMMQMNATSAPLPPEASEFQHAALTPVASALVRPPRVKEAKAALECKVTEVLRLKRHDGGDTDSYMAIGQVVGVHIADDVIRNGIVDPQAMRVVARLGYKHYSVTDHIFELQRPPGGGDLKREG
jgi:flavin reductase (DIM6/NTAB) family NADH-FMN oxidoreductase RutF